MIAGILHSLLAPDTILAILFGTIGGVVIGALPGLTTTMAVALLIPVTYGMNPTAAIVMLAAVYTASNTGSAIPAILIHTPGTPASAATVLDGYPLALKGQGLKAIGVATIGSVIGGLASALILLLLAPPLAKISLRFSAAEYFLMALFGLTIIGSLASESMIKGLTAGVFGLMVGLVGLSNNGYIRYSFGIMSLTSGIDMVPAMIGLFSLTQVLTQVEAIEAADAIMQDAAKVRGSFFPTWEEFRRLIPCFIRATLIGAFVGILPGAGGDVASWVAYNEEKRASKHKELFGTGLLEGVAAPETSNNALTGCALIPTLTFGIPGSATCAVILGGLTVQGLVPGWQLFTTYAHVTYAIIIGFFIANFLMGVFTWLAARPIVKATQVPTAIMMPIIVVLAVVGSFAMGNTMYPVYIMVIFGGIGFFMHKFGFSPAPTVLALILGPMAEKSLSQAIMMSKVPILRYFFTRPLSLVIMAIILLTLISPIISRHRKQKKARSS